ncbi:MAG: cupin domain-containing protein [Alphaproteobacteria bacterium]|nr:cupin domain-containing protein [Alphaproteobacteria bacterium]
MSNAVRHTNRVSRDQAAIHDWGSIQWLVNREIFPTTGITFGYVEIEPGQKNPKHHHPNSDEILYLIEGELEHSIGAESVVLKPGDVLHISSNVPHDARNTGKVTARMVVGYPTGDRRIVMHEAGVD